MRFKSILLAGAAVVVVAHGANAGELRGTYFALEGGASWVGDERFFRDLIFTTGSPAHTEYQGSFETGWSVFGTVGHAFENGFRAEFEMGYRRNNFDGLVSTGGTPLLAGGDLSEFTLMANVLYDFNLSDKVSASIGVGAGADRTRLTLDTLPIEDDDWSFAYQAIAGLNYAIGARTHLFVNYRYLRADAPDYSVSFAGSPAGTQHVEFRGDIEKQTVSMGLRFQLNGEAPPVVVPPAPPPPPPPPPPAPKTPKEFIVFFGYDKSALTDEARRIVADAAFAAKELGSASIVIVGHTDSMGSNTYNQALSEKRAKAVSMALQGEGIAGDKISVSGEGESQLLVQTGDSVREPQNRRASINLQ